MKYEKIKYISIDGREEFTIKRTDKDGNIVFIPADEANTDYKQYLADISNKK